MNYDKLSRSLRYYYEKGIMQKVAGESASRRARAILFTFFLRGHEEIRLLEKGLTS